MKFRYVSLLGIVLAVFLPSWGLAATVIDTIKDTSDIHDTYIREIGDGTTYATYNYGAATILYMQQNSTLRREVLVYWDADALVDIDTSVSLTSAKLMLYCSAEVDATVSVYEMLKPVKEGTGSGAARNGTTCWTDWDYPDSTWSYWGADHSGAIDANHGQTRAVIEAFAPAAKVPTANAGWLSGGGAVYQSENVYGRLYTLLTPDTGAVTGFGFTIPTGAIIDSLFVTIEGYYIESVGSISSVRINRGSVASEVLSLSDVLTTSDAIHTFGKNRTTQPTNPLWNITWTGGQLSASTAGVKIVSNADFDTVAVDQITMQVKYRADTCLDRSSAVMSSQSVTTASQYYEFAIDTALIRAHANGTKAGFGIVLVASGIDGLTGFTSSEGTAAQVPLLIVQYESGVAGAVEVVNYLHGPGGSGVRHSISGGSTLHEP